MQLNRPVFALSLTFAALFAPMQEALAQARTMPAQRFVCESRDNRETYCRADTRNGVALVRSLSRERCTIGRNWGYDRNGIWVADGCRGEFALGNPGNGYGWGSGNRFTGYVYCESIGNRRNECAINARGGVRLINQVSRSPCIEGRTWGHTPRAIWVSGGCRGEFEVRLGGPDIPPPRPVPLPAPAPLPRPLPAEALITCESLDGRDRLCRLPLNADRVVLERQLSRSPCIEGRTWGYRQAAIYVTQGCRAEFRVVDFRGDRSGPDDRFSDSDEQFDQEERYDRERGDQDYGDREFDDDDGSFDDDRNDRHDRDDRDDDDDYDDGRRDD